MKHRWVKAFPWLLCVIFAACSPEHEDAPKPAANLAVSEALFSVGSVTVLQSDLDHQIRESHGGRTDDATRKEALAQLADRARLIQAALDEQLLDDPFVRAEFARILAARFKEQKLFPRLKEIADTEIPESRLRELYTANLSRYQSNEMRQVAVLWLNPGKDPQREKQYIAKLSAAREWFSQNEDLVNNPEMGFSTLAVDHSEHQASRYHNGIVGWVEEGSGPDSWTKAVSEIAFSLPQPGAVSDVVANLDGVFLVRYVSARPAVTRPFESVSGELVRDEKERLRQSAETEFKTALDGKYPIQSHSP